MINGTVTVMEGGGVVPPAAGLMAVSIRAITDILVMDAIAAGTAAVEAAVPDALRQDVAVAVVIKLVS